MKTTTQPNNDHKKILALLQKGDPLAMEKMYDLFAPMLYGVALKMVKSETKAEDLLQEVFLHFYKNHSSFDESKQNIYLWMIGIMRMFARKKMQIVSHIQNQKPLFYVDTGIGEKPLESFPLFKSADERDSLINIDQKNILDLVFLSGEKISAVAKSLGMDESKIKKLLREAVNIHRKVSESESWK